tara:strand:- start:68 stop:271 length:204 start_codon:yes stop_codon:yes gene_type:complete
MKKETSEERKKRIKSMSSSKRIELIRKKMKQKGIVEGSGVANKTYNNDEVIDLIKISSCFPEWFNRK